MSDLIYLILKIIPRFNHHKKKIVDWLYNCTKFGMKHTNFFYFLDEINYNINSIER